MIILERLNEVTSPRDAETIVTSYFGDCRPTREFLQAYLQKRNLLPSKVSGIFLTRGGLGSQSFFLGCSYGYEPKSSRWKASKEDE